MFSFKNSVLQLSYVMQTGGHVQKVTFYRWEDMPKEKVNDLLDRRLITGDRMMLAHVYLKKG